LAYPVTCKFLQGDTDEPLKNAEIKTGLETRPTNDRKQRSAGYIAIPQETAGWRVVASTEEIAIG
ncbi:MAG: hypothetical protein ACK5OB_20510, partial [Pirellula sp.]